VTILTPLTTNEYTVKDSFSFANDISKVDSNCVMASLDIESLFTNIPLDETVQYCIDDLFKDKSLFNNFDKKSLKDLLDLAVKESFFKFDNLYYRQKDGVAMGSPLGPTLANAFLCHFEKNWLENCPLEFRPKFYKRYVDDIFVLFSSQDEVKKCVNYMNDLHPNIKFTYDIEKDHTFSFLDVKITRENNHFSTSVYRKPTFSGVYTNFNSFIPNEYKCGLINTLLFRGFNICSSYEKFHQEVVILKEFLKLNSFPERIIDYNIKKFLNNIFTPKKVQLTAEKKPVLVVLPFLGKISLEIKKRIYRCIKKNIPYCKPVFAFQSKNRLSNIFRFKDTFSKDLQSHIVYKFQCGICNDTYYGKTERHFKVRASEHLGITPLTNKRVKKPKESAVNEHLLYFGHDANFESFEILAKESNAFKLAIKESLLISRDKPPLNKNIYSIPLQLFS